MTPYEIKQARKALGWTVNDLADALRMAPSSGNRTIRRWENGDLPITGPAMVAIEAMLAGYIPEHFLEDDDDNWTDNDGTEDHS